MTNKCVVQFTLIDADAFKVGLARHWLSGEGREQTKTD